MAMIMIINMIMIIMIIITIIMILILIDLVLIFTGSPCLDIGVKVGVVVLPGAGVPHNQVQDRLVISILHLCSYSFDEIWLYIITFVFISAFCFPLVLTPADLGIAMGVFLWRGGRARGIGYSSSWIQLVGENPCFSYIHLFSFVLSYEKFSRILRTLLDRYSFRLY